MRPPAEVGENFGHTPALISIARWTASGLTRLSRHPGKWLPPGLGAFPPAHTASARGWGMLLPDEGSGRGDRGDAYAVVSRSMMTAWFASKSEYPKL